jgi:hypothetical protein
MTTAYDKAKWHLEGDFPPDLPEEQASVHEGMFLAWLCENSLLSDEFREDFDHEISEFKKGAVSRASFFDIIGGVLADDMVSDEIKPFMKFYYGKKTRYYDDYAELFSDHPSLYHVKDTSENFHKVSARLSERFKEWKRH